MQSKLEISTNCAQLTQEDDGGKRHSRASHLFESITLSIRVGRYSGHFPDQVKLVIQTNPNFLGVSQNS